MPDRTTQSHQLFASQARTADANSESFSVSDKSSAVVMLDVTAVSSVVANIHFEHSHNGTDWFVHPDGNISRITSIQKVVRHLDNLASNVRAVLTVSGTSITFSLVLDAKN
jgi:hypothetical protein